MTLLSITRGAATVAPYGTNDFATHLAAREQRLGLAARTPDASAPETTCVITQDSHEQSHIAPRDASDPDAAPPMGDMGVKRDAWGNVVTSAPRLDGAYTFTSRTWEPGGRTIYVCGSPAAHVAGGYWQLDKRMERGQGYICAACWCIQAGLYGIVEGR